jgi:phosphatidylinositol phospholipase C delta
MPAETVTMSKGPGLMRRISRGAANKIRRRQSSSHGQRDHSTGPIILRRRSDSKSGNASTKDVFDTDYADADEESVVDGVFGLGVSDVASITSEPMGRDTVGVAPVANLVLQGGTYLTKVTKRKRKHLKFYLDYDHAKVYWNPTNPAKQFYIDDIKEIRRGVDARNYREEFGISDIYESRWFTILYANQERSKGRFIKTMHLIAPNPQLFDMWTNTLDDIARYRIDLMAGFAGSGSSEKFLLAHWQREMKKAQKDDESLDLAAVEGLCKSLHINSSNNMLRASFAKADKGNKGRLVYSEFKEFVKRLKERQDVKEIFNYVAYSTTEGVDYAEFENFLEVHQGVKAKENEEHWKSIFEKYVRKSKLNAQAQQDLEDGQPSRMNLEAFTSFLVSSSNSVYAKQPEVVELDRPLNEYYISSSHNTYLLGRQVAGESSTEAYVAALQHGCRCVEIDCWDGADGRPMVSHGRTLTTSIPFADCITVISRYAFGASDYPLILSLEVHCNPEQQLIMVEIMKKELGDRLVLDPLNSSHVLPSPEQLKHRILIKVKTSDSSSSHTPTSGPHLPINGINLDAMDAGRRRSASSPFARPTVLDSPNPLIGIPLSSPPSMSPPDGGSHMWSPGRRSMTATSVSSATEDSDVPAVKREKKKPSKSRIIKALSDLGVYTRGYKWHSFATVEANRYNHVFSIAEKALESICRDSELKAQLENHNISFLTRVYPSQFRIKSSNFDPNAFWRRGVQMVALNWQTYDIGMQMNQAMFAAGADRLGYVLKPEALRDAPSPDLFHRRKLEKKLVRFSVKVISAQQLPRPRGMGSNENINPYVEIEMFSAEDKAKNIATGEGGSDASSRNGMSGIGFPHRRRTKMEQANGYNPIFNDEFKLSLETKYQDLVFVRWVVWNAPDMRPGSSSCVQLATFTAKLSSLQQGYRHLPLYDGNGDQFLFSTLFCQITKQPAVSAPNSNLDEMKSERVGIFRQLGHTVFKRQMSGDRENRSLQDDGRRSSSDPRSERED